MEIGALLVGRIYNHHQSYPSRSPGEGLPSLGESTIVVLYPANRIKLDKILDNLRLRYRKPGQNG